MKIKKYKIGLFLSLCILELILVVLIFKNIANSQFYSPIEILNEKSTIKVMSFNIHHGDGKTIDEHRGKAYAIAQYMKENNIELAGLQEVSVLPDPDVSVLLEEQLNSVGYPMYIFAAPKNNEYYFLNVILSKYPFYETTSYGQNPCKSEGKCDRAVVVAKVNTPVGPVTFVNTHVHGGSDNCESLKQYFNIVQPYLQDTNAIFVGDYNTGPSGGSCKTKPQDYFSKSCKSSKNCSDGIDWVYIVKQGSNFRQLSRVKSNLKISDHAPVLSTLQLINTVTLTPFPTPSPTAVATPTPIPTVLPTPDIFPSITPTISLTPTPSASSSIPIPSLVGSEIDLDANGKINISDFVKFTVYYKANDCIIDFNFNTNCQEIGDFVYFVEEYRRSRNNNL